MRKLYIFLFLLFFLPSCSSTSFFLSQERPPDETIRVAILRDADVFSLRIRSPYTIVIVDTGEVHESYQALKDSLVKPCSVGIKIEEKIFEGNRVKVIPQREASIFINNKDFRGEVDIVKTPGNQLTVINILELEQYLKGVLASEVPDRWPLEVLKAQAVAARTYTFYIKESKRQALYDLTNDIFAQVYGGRGVEKYRTNFAIDQTRGMVLMYKDQFLPAYYHSTCAGHTEDVSELWKQDLVPLKGQPCIFCKESPHAFWKRNLRLKDIQDKLNAHNYNLGLIKEIAIIERNASQRIKTLAITTRDGKEVRISGKDFRNIVGPNLIKSNNYIIEMQGYYVDFYGKGWGHGVGLCQWGAHEMSRQGYRFDDILKYYYPAAKIVHYQTLGRRAR